MRYVAITLQQAKQAMTSMVMPESLADAMNEPYALAPPGHLAGVLDTVQTVTGRPARTFAQFAKDQAAAFRTA